MLVQVGTRAGQDTSNPYCPRYPLEWQFRGARWAGGLEYGGGPRVQGGPRRKIFNRVICCLSSYGEGKHFDAPVLISRPRLERTIDKVADAIDRPHKDARLKAVKGVLQVQQDVCGIKVDNDAVRVSGHTGLDSRQT